MSKRVIYTKDEIVDKAYEMLKEGGLNWITARNLAKKLKTSPAPIYGHFNSMEILKEELIKKSKEQFLKYINISYTDKPLLNFGMGFVIFAREEKELFRAIFLIDSSYKDVISEFKNLIFQKVEEDSRFTGIEIEKIEWLFEKCWVYSHGLATLIALDFTEDSSNESIQKNLMDMAIFFDYILVK